MQIGGLGKGKGHGKNEGKHESRGWTLFAKNIRSKDGKKTVCVRVYRVLLVSGTHTRTHYTCISKQQHHINTNAFDFPTVQDKIPRAFYPFA